MNLANRKWITTYPEKGRHPVARAGGFSVDIPKTGSLNYIITQSMVESGDARRLTIKGRVECAPGTKFTAIDRNGSEGLEPNFRPMLMHDMYGALNRWWCDDHVTLAGNESFVLSIPLTPDRWTSVFGRRGDENSATEKAFRRVRSRCYFGLTFGGGSNYGHGVRATPKATVHMTHYSLSNDDCA